MSDANDIRGQIARGRAKQDAEGRRLAALRAQLAGVRRQLAAARRLGPLQADAAAVLQKQADGLARQVTEAWGSVGQARAAVTGLLGQLATLADPTAAVGGLKDSVPILLFPVRVEVRFRNARPAGTAAVSRELPQLWVRIYPDDCQIDGFEPLLSDAEVTSATAFWIATWRAGGVEAQARGAWRKLVGALGSGRAAYLIGQFAPAVPTPPTKANPQDVVLVIVPATDVTAGEQAAAFAYWISVWTAGSDPTKIQAARAVLEGAVGAARAAVLVKDFAPDPGGWDPPKPYTRAGVAVSCAVLKLPAGPTTTQTSWTQPARAVAMPDRFVVLAYQAGVEVKRAFGNPVPDGLATTPDPSLPDGSQLTVVDGDLQLNDDLRWLADFDAAVAVGMGLKIDLTDAEAVTGFDRLLVVGVRTSSDENASADLLGSLISTSSPASAATASRPRGARRTTPTPTTPLTPGSTIRTPRTTRSSRDSTPIQRAPIRSRAATASGSPKRSASTRRSSSASRTPRASIRLRRGR